MLKLLTLQELQVCNVVRKLWADDYQMDNWVKKVREDKQRETSEKKPCIMVVLPTSESSESETDFIIPTIVIRKGKSFRFL